MQRSGFDRACGICLGVAMGDSRSLRLLSSLISTCLAFSAAVNVLKALPIATQGYGVPYWKLTYEHGFIRRALVGTIFQACAMGHVGAATDALILQIHVLATLALCGVLARWWVRAETRDDESRFLAKIVVGAFVFSAFIPTMLANAGYLDVFLFLIVTMAAFAARLGRPGLAGLIGVAGPLVHDGFLFLWLALVAIALRRAFDEETRGGRLSAARSWLVPMLAPVLSTALVLAFHSPSAARQSVEQAQLPPDVHESFIRYQFGLGPSGAMRLMMAKFGADPSRTLACVAWFGMPSIVIASCAACLDRHRSQIVRIVSAAVVTLAPCTILLVAWDLSRFLLWSTLTSFLWAMMCAEAPKPIGRAAGGGSHAIRHVLAASTAVLAVFAWTPHVYAYFEVADAMLWFGPEFLTRTPQARVVYAGLAWYNEHYYPSSWDSRDGRPLVAVDGGVKVDGAVIVDPHGEAWLPVSRLPRGEYLLRAETAACDSATGAFVLESLTTWRFTPGRAEVKGVSGANAELRFAVSEAEAATTPFVLRARGIEGCTRVDRITLRALDRTR